MGVTINKKSTTTETETGRSKNAEKMVHTSKGHYLNEQCFSSIMYLFKMGIALTEKN